jgi:hypothetical protein
MGVLDMKKLAVGLSIGLLMATGLSGDADARPGRGKAYGHYKHGYRHAAPSRGYYVVPGSRRRSNGGAVAAGVAGAIIGGALTAATRPSYRYYERPAYGYYSAPRRYYRDDYYDNY